MWLLLAMALLAALVDGANGLRDKRPAGRVLFEALPSAVAST